MLKGFSTFPQVDPDLTRLQENIRQVLSPITSNMLLDGKIDSYKVVSGSNSITHKLGRKPNGYILVGKSGYGDFYHTSMNEDYLVLQANAAITLTLYIF
jgi:hypothetical protein